MKSSGKCIPSVIQQKRDRQKHIELTHMEFCVLKLMISGYTIDDISTLYNIKPKTTYTYSNSIMKQLGFTL
ncbi:Uncharacterised protein [Enterobacter cloacae]|uniref:HTH luxR-type domain-containing protein n=1 Tax=Enterobacter cloacae TaxID=550 RepID=A0A377M8Q8_ENTCL|nr:Uncharacterised protein [Enterobacter cloacae]